MTPGRERGSVDVVVPTYGYGRYLRQCVHSVLAQGVDLRVLVIDDCSPDDTPQVARALVDEDPRVAYVRHERNQGHIATFNEGIGWASGDYMLLLSADDYLLPGALDRAVAMLDAHPEMTLCVGQARVLHADGRMRDVRVDPHAARAGDRVLTGAGFIEMLVAAGARNTVVSATAVVRTFRLHELGGYRPDLPHSGDLEMWMRMASHGSVGIVDEAQAVYRRHAANMSDGYARDHGLADLQQRREAIDVFGREAAATLPQAARLRRRLHRVLAREALGQASSAHGEGALALSRQLLALGVEMAPSSRFSRERLRLLVKQLLGVEASRALVRARARWREMRAPGAIVPPRGEPGAGAATPVEEP